MMKICREWRHALHPKLTKKMGAAEQHHAYLFMSCVNAIKKLYKAIVVKFHMLPFVS